MHTLITLGQENTWIFEDPLKQAYYEILTHVCVNMYYDELNKSRDKLMYRIFLPYHEYFTVKNGDVIVINNHSFYNLLYKNNYILATFINILSILFEREIISSEIIGKNGKNSKVLIMRSKINKESFYKILSKSEHIIIKNIFEKLGKTNDVVLQNNKDNVVSLDKLEINISYDKYTVEEKNDIEEFISGHIQTVIKSYEEKIYNKINEIEHNTNISNSDCERQIKLLQTRIKDNEFLKNKMIEHEKIKNEKDKKDKVEQELSVFISQLKFPICDICVEKVDPKNIITMDCNHPACIKCYRKRYKLPEKGGILTGGIILKCIGCESSLGQCYFGQILNKDEIMFYMIESVKYSVMTPNELRKLHICICSQCKISYTATPSCEDRVTQTRCDDCIKKDPNIDIVYCSNEHCRNPLSRMDGCNVIQCVCTIYTCFNCGERLGGDRGHDARHFVLKQGQLQGDQWFKNECCQGRGITSAIPSILHSKTGAILKLKN